jgi:acyl-CoA reductase-like NAD-dependent aldehyde dehydrogenase
VDIAKAYKLGDPTKADTTLGPVVSVASASRIRKQVKDAGEWWSWLVQVILGLSAH